MFTQPEDPHKMTDLIRVDGGDMDDPRLDLIEITITIQLKKTLMVDFQEL
jgi:hypothetical protein